MTQMMGKDLGSRTVGDVVAEDYRRAAVFQRFGIDFCCGGGRSVGAACERSGAALDEVARALAAVGGSRDGSEPDERTWELEVLGKHIVAVHHGYVREALPALLQFAEKVARVHGARHTELLEIRALVGELATELVRHLEDEERDLFPRVARLVAAGRDGEAAPPAEAGNAAAGAGAPLGALEDDHEHAGAIMHRIRELSGGFAPPADACTTYRALYANLEEFESDLHRHVHLENNVLFPGVRALEAAEA